MTNDPDPITWGIQEERERVRHIIIRKRHEYEDISHHYGPEPFDSEDARQKDMADMVVEVLELLDSEIVRGGA